MVFLVWGVEVVVEEQASGPSNAFTARARLSVYSDVPCPVRPTMQRLLSEDGSVPETSEDEGNVTSSAYIGQPPTYVVVCRLQRALVNGPFISRQDDTHSSQQSDHLGCVYVGRRRYHTWEGVCWERS